MMIFQDWDGCVMGGRSMLLRVASGILGRSIRRQNAPFVNHIVEASQSDDRSKPSFVPTSFHALRSSDGPPETQVYV